MKIKLIDFGMKYAPERAHYNDAGADVHVRGDWYINPHGTRKIPLGFGLELPDGYAAFVFPRSSWSSKGVACELPPVDSGYKGQIHAVVTNHTDECVKISDGERIGQLVVVPVVVADFVTDVGTERGSGAFGSTGR